MSNKEIINQTREIYLLCDFDMIEIIMLIKLKEDSGTLSQKCNLILDV